MKKISSVNDGGSLESKNFGLSQTAFRELLEALRAGNDDLYQQVFLAHFEDCLNFLKRQYNASHEDAYDASMDGLVAFCDLLKKGRIQYGNLRFLFTQMAGQQYLKKRKEDSRLQELTAEWDMADEPVSDLPTGALDTFNQAWPQLGKGCQQLLKSFFYDQQKLKEIATQLEKNEATVRKQKQRCVEKLQEIFQSLYQ
ncbi:RNA polymerase sigma factor [Lewinella sp. LCG006]|uniref:RNA polymerase sigma factor n=1 Tax=Lewinella sp. LCG006 TaxID=3231911 RepID=UPI0034609746